MTGSTLVIGLGEVGRPLMEVVQGRFDTVGIDIEPVSFDGKCDVMHICFPFQIPDFIGECVFYIEKYKPGLTIINSTVAPGTTRSVYQRVRLPIAYSPVRGKHARMRQDLLHYVKFIGGIDSSANQLAANHFEAAGLKVKTLSSPETVELAKLTETSYFGLLIAWAQEVERYSDQLSLRYDEVVSYFEEIKYLPPVKYFPGIIGGHCVLPNIEILKTIFDSRLLEAIEESNRLKVNRETGEYSDS